MKNFEMSRACSEIISRKFQGDMDTDQFYLALMELDRKFPMQGHAPPLTKDKILNRRSTLIIVDDPSVDIEYLTDLQPNNFREAAEIYAYNRSRFNSNTVTVKQEHHTVLDRKSIASGEKQEEVPF